jgi:site-specific DNA-methyltransferase (adenine-specific)
MNKLDALFSSKKQDWETPPYIISWLENKLARKFTLDPCATADNRKAPMWFDEKTNGLTQDWAPHNVFMNPPYGGAIKHWVKKAYDEFQKGAFVVGFIPARTETRYWFDYIWNKDNVAVWFIKGRVKFLPLGTPAPFPSCLVIWNPELDGDFTACGVKIDHG